MTGGRCPPDLPNFGWGGAKPPHTHPLLLLLNGRSSHLIKAAKWGRLDQMLFVFRRRRTTPERLPNAPETTGTEYSHIDSPLICCVSFLVFCYEVNLELAVALACSFPKSFALELDAAHLATLKNSIKGIS